MQVAEVLYLLGFPSVLGRMALVGVIYMVVYAGVNLAARLISDHTSQSSLRGCVRLFVVFSYVFRLC